MPNTLVICTKKGQLSMPNNKVELDQNMKDNILKYNDQIKTIDSFVEAVRQTIGMYIGRRGNRGFMNLIREVYQNSIDEIQGQRLPLF